MSIAQNISKIAAAAAGVSLVAMSLAPAAFAQTTGTTTTTSSTTMSSAQIAALQAQIAALQAQLSASQGATVSTTFTTDLTIGSTGSQVTALQTWLIAKGYSIPAGATGYFGTQTQAAVAAYQAANGISPAAGYFGPITRAQVNAMGSTTTTTTTTGTGSTTTTTTGSTTLSGGEGTINNFQTIGATSVTLGTGASQQVYGFQFQAGGSDLNVSRIYYDLVNTGTTGTTRPWNIFQTATLTDASGKTIATLDATNQANYSEDGTLASGSSFNNGSNGVGNQIYRLDFENLNTIVKMNATQTYYLTLSTQSAYASGNVATSGTQFSVALAPQGLRATDAMGIQQYSTSNVSPSVVLLNQNTSGTVNLSTGSDNPQTTTVMANQNTSTQGVVLNTFSIQNTGTTNVELYTLPVYASSTLANTTVGSLVQSLMLYQGSTLLDTESPSSATSTAVVSFKNLNLQIPAGQTLSFKVTANISAVGYSNPVPNGAGVIVTVPGGTTGNYGGNTIGTPDIENTGGAIVTTNGSSTGYPISFATTGISIASNPTSATATTQITGNSGNTQTGTFTFTFNVTAFGQSIYVGTGPSAFSMQLVTSTTTTALTNAALTSTASLDGAGNYMVSSGQTQAFTITGTQIGGGTYYHAILKSLNFGTSDANVTASSTAFPSNYTTPAVFIQS